MPLHHWNTLDAGQRRAVLQRPAIKGGDDIEKTARDIIARVRAGGDAALRELTRELDGVTIADLRVSDAELRAAEKELSRAAIAAIETAIANVACFHKAQRQPAIDLETMPGVRCERVTRPLDAVGLYVPAGSAPLPSAAIMLAVPADIAGCRRKALCTPPRKDGSVDAAVLVAAQRAGVNEIYKVGGAQAIAALAYGSESIGRVDKIFGPGNAWVTAAKTLVAGVAGGTAIDLPAGPSEVLVIADESAAAAFVAADLLSQAEHGADSQVILLTTSATLADNVQVAVAQQLTALSRQPVAAAALAHSQVIVCADIDEAIAISNDYAPEHLILQINEPRGVLPAILNAGSVFVGPWTPEAVGDYCSGTNHVLPTYGAARNFSGLGLDHFQRQMTVQELTFDGLSGLAPTVRELAGLEGLDAHAAAVNVRLAARKAQRS
jgi:histidinol dehydrogenase